MATTPHFLADLKLDEGCRLKAYKDTVGVWTVGYGHAHVAPDTVWTQEQASAALIIDVKSTAADLDRLLPWWRTLNPARQDVILNMAFNMGAAGVAKFRNTLADVKAGNYERASQRMMQSLWARQVKGRAVRLSKQMLTGVR